MANEAIQFDTHKFVKHLTGVGFTEQQAEALASEQVDLLNSNLATKTDIEQINADLERLRLATKADLEQLRLATKTDIEQLRLATKTDIEQIKADIEQLRLATRADLEQNKVELLKWMIGAMIAQGGLIVGLIAYIN